MNPPATHYFVWYRVPGDAGAARARVDALQRELESRTGVIGRLLMRPGAPPTWMEIYEGVRDPSAFEAALAEVAAHHGVAAHAPAGRHVESFVDAR